MTKRTLYYFGYAGTLMIFLENIARDQRINNFINKQ